ncbi:unnamed protein product [Lathyrus sativus]|nr:unnamed protein product [Lathyrus sativus]
MSLLVGMK